MKYKLKRVKSTRGEKNKSIFVREKKIIQSQSVQKHKLLRFFASGFVSAVCHLLHISNPLPGDVIEAITVL